VQRVFEIFDVEREGTIAVGTYLDKVRRITRGTTREKLRFLFKVYDIGSDGLLSFTELREVIRCCMQENGLSFPEEVINKMTQVLMADAVDGGSRSQSEASTSSDRTDADVTEMGPSDHIGLSFDQFMHLFDKSPGLMENVARSVDHLLLPPPSSSKPVREDPFRRLRWAYVWRNLSTYFFFMTFLVICVLLTCQRFWQYRPKERGEEKLTDGETIFVQVARSGGICLNFTTSLILLFVLRRCITFLRSHGFSSFLPLDQNIYFHKVVGYCILAFSLIHILAHGLNYGESDNSSSCRNL